MQPLNPLPSPPRLLLLALTLLALLPCTLAQFQFFQSGGFPFGGGQAHGHGHGHAQGHEQGGRPGRQYKGWMEAEAVHCRAGYVCPQTLHCVPTPADCPCPYPEDVKCPVSDPRPRDEGEGPPFICVRSGGCDEVDAFSRGI